MPLRYANALPSLYQRRIKSPLTGNLPDSIWIKFGLYIQKDTGKYCLSRVMVGLMG